MTDPTQALAVVEPHPMAHSDPESILRYAIDRGADVSVIERMVVIRRELEEERAKKEFNDALAAFQAECPVIEKRKEVMNKDGRSVRYKFAPLDSIVSQVRGLLSKHGFSYTIDAETKDKAVKATCTITHRGGHSKPSSFEAPIEPGAFMNAPQLYASALTFAKRYAFCNGLGILTGDEDIDGKLAKEKPDGPSKLAADSAQLDGLRKELWHLLLAVRGDAKSWTQANQWLIDECVIGPEEAAPHFTAARYAQVISKVKEKFNVH